MQTHAEQSRAEQSRAEQSRATTAATAEPSPPGPSSAQREGRFPGRHVVGTAALWVLTRAVMVYLLVHESIGQRGVTGEVTGIYRRWYEVLVTGRFPVHDAIWQYPPGAAAVLLSPEALPFLTFFQGFVAVVVLCDVLVTVALARAGRSSGGSRAGMWLWLAGLPLLLHVPYARYDLQVTALAVLSLLCVRRRPRAAGALAGLGAMVKVWPALVLLGTPRGRGTRQAWASAVAAALALLAVFAVLFRGSLDFLGNQQERGIQIESVGGTALQAARLLGLWQGHVAYRYGSLEYVGPYVSSVAHLMLGLTAVAFCWLLLWRVRARRWTAATPFDAALCAVLLFVVTSRVLSPQYLVWLLGLAAVCLSCRRTTQRPVARLVLAATPVTALAYPLNYSDVMAGNAFGTALMVVRNGLLLAAAFWSCRRLWAASVAGGDVKGGRPASRPPASRPWSRPWPRP
ncbi:glycosyltransferase 87 family protein [Streptomyces sp. WAC06614]|uniref:glycosyltransferase 87 family protein n=1 Tax=Streptomyces sp. WAC06614 TaxID=2487416 RepID=UPI000F7B6E00|nr:glycosyltransferase 87 family protein [Streptomyces sp. WAC06614]RSS61143.1 DUF2029 domain-containing protein [Streptomyces sp. WAC06614]